MTLNITLHLSDEQEAQLREHLAHDEFQEAQKLLAQALYPTVQNLLKNPEPVSSEDFRKRLNESAALFSSFIKPETPILDDEALSRESMYEDRW